MYEAVVLCAFHFLAHVSSEVSHPEVSRGNPPCESDIYCHGRLLHTVQMSNIYEDSKTFVDLKMRQNADVTMENFDSLMLAHGGKPTRDQVAQFVNESFEPAGQEFEDWVPEDWTPTPHLIKEIQDDKYKSFALALNHIWKELGRKMRDDVAENLDLYSIIWVPNPVIVPGGRFREFYYWDSYWIVQGLLHSDMHQTVRGMLENFAYIVDTYGHIPNGGRIYYLERSQPPLFVPTVKLYVDHTGDTDFVHQHLHTFDKEFHHWVTNRCVTVEKNGKYYQMFHYSDSSHGPRPESYSEDVESAAFFHDAESKNEFYKEIKAAAETGWDFSCRWFISPNATNSGNLTQLRTRSIVPVDLNSIMYWNAMILAEWYDQLGNTSMSEYYSSKAKEILDAVEAVLWHQEVGSWLDYDMTNGVKRDWWYTSNISPLWTGCYNRSNTNQIVEAVLKYLKPVVQFPAGVPTSMQHTGEQWDYPNVWPPLQHMLIVGLDQTGHEDAKQLAFELTDRWVRANYKAFIETNAMFEKYDVLGGHGGGGEYEVQVGFGWSNGVILDLLHRYGDVLEMDCNADNIAEENRIVEEIVTAPETITMSKAIPTQNISALVTGFLALVIAMLSSYTG